MAEVLERSDIFGVLDHIGSFSCLQVIETELCGVIELTMVGEVVGGESMPLSVGYFNKMVPVVRGTSISGHLL